MTIQTIPRSPREYDNKNRMSEVQKISPRSECSVDGRTDNAPSTNIFDRQFMRRSWRHNPGGNDIHQFNAEKTGLRLTRDAGTMWDECWANSVLICPAKTWGYLLILRHRRIRWSMGQRIVVSNIFSAGIDFGHQILTFKVDPRDERIKYL